MAQLQGVFLDFYGTLAAGDRAAVIAICTRVCEDLGLSITGENLAIQWGSRYFAAIEDTACDFRLLVDLERDTLIETLAGIGRTIDPEPYIKLFNEYLAAPTIFDEVREVLANLHVPACVVSNADERELRLAIGHLDLDLPLVVTSELARSYKPDAAIFRRALDLTGWDPGRVLHVGDSLHSDVGGARRVGIRAAWVNRSERISDIGTETPDYTWSDLRPLLLMNEV